MLTNACSADGPTVPTGSTPLDLLSALRTVPDLLSVGEPTTVTIGGHAGLSASLDISEGALAACGSFGNGDMAVFPVGTETWRAQPGERVRLARASDHCGHRCTVINAVKAGATTCQEQPRRARRPVTR